ncbi:hypothetical protein BDP27DRAFT_1318054 [Rhodocollybia butyracea]|uniref:Uncharacterized protein n=1 Tax=Rhodocollybia butyracea TaxID=206335 RepID=A0A9P5PWE7_9AGAR|nr:hypothetical protein BDP27DRAFT_1318054 [Rhodocollybia butyracea]
MQFTKIHSALLLTLVASLTLAVSSQPVHKDPVRQLKLSFLNPLTGGLQLGGGKPPDHYTENINKALKMVGAKWEPVGTYLPVEGNKEKTILKLEGGPHCPLDAPCYAWRVKGPHLAATTKKKPADPDSIKRRMDYIGITKGLPNEDGKAECIGVFPTWARDDSSAAAKQQWETYRDEFNSMSIPGVPKTGSVVEPFQTAPSVIFIHIEDGQPLQPTNPSADPKDDKNAQEQFRRAMTSMLNHIFGLSGRAATYKFPPNLSSQSTNKLHHFKLIGGDERCTTVTPCYGWIEKSLYTLPGDTTEKVQGGLYLGLVKPKIGGNVEIIGSYPEVNEDEGRAIDEPMGKEWTTQLLAFTVKLKLMLSKQ